jgi:hypothetical protein
MAGAPSHPMPCLRLSACVGGPAPIKQKNRRTKTYRIFSWRVSCKPAENPTQGHLTTRSKRTLLVRRGNIGRPIFVGFHRDSVSLMPYSVIGVIRRGFSVKVPMTGGILGSTHLFRRLWWGLIFLRADPGVVHKWVPPISLCEKAVQRLNFGEKLTGEFVHLESTYYTKININRNWSDCISGVGILCI